MKKVIVAESSPTIKSVADSLLRQSGYDVVCTSDGLQAWEVISAEKPDLVLVGASLSGISGLDLCRQINSNAPTGGIPVVLMIGANDSIREEELVASGARGRLKKPFSPKDLLDIVAKLAGQRPSAVTPGAMPETKFVTQVSSTQQSHKKQETYNLEWLDLNDSTNSKQIAKVASFDLGNDDQTLIIDNDQYGLANSIPEPEEQAPIPAEEKDSDYDWFVGEMKREMQGKSGVGAKTQDHATADPKISADIGFEDIRPAAGPDDHPRQDKTTAITSRAEENRSPAQNSGHGSPPLMPPTLHLSDEQIAAIADQIVSKLASAIASRLDRNYLIDAIKSGLRS